MEKGWKNKDIHKCFFPEIKKYLIKSDVTEISYFEDRLRDYINFLLSKEYIDKIIFVTFPHFYDSFFDAVFRYIDKDRVVMVYSKGVILSTRFYEARHAVIIHFGLD